MWRDLFGKPREPSAELASVLADLGRLARDRPELESPARTLGRVLLATFAVDPATAAGPNFGPDDPRHESILDAWRSGEPAFASFMPHFDLADLRRRSAAIVKALAVEDRAVIAIIQKSFSSGHVATSFAWGDSHVVERVGLANPGDVELMRSITRLMVLPVLAALSAKLAPHRPPSIAPVARCPNCGHPPVLAETRGLEGQRIMRCGTCAAEWPMNRLGCVACGESAPHAVRSLFVEGEESRHRLVICDACGFSLKVTSTHGPLSAPGLVVAELALVHLDFL